MDYIGPRQLIRAEFNEVYSSASKFKEKKRKTGEKKRIRIGRKRQGAKGNSMDKERERENSSLFSSLPFSLSFSLFRCLSAGKWRRLKIKVAANVIKYYMRSV